MTFAMKQSFGAELSRIAGKMKESAAWPSPSTGLAFHILQLLDDGHRHWPDCIKITFPEGQLDTAPLIASAGYSMCIAMPNPEQSARWQSALARIVKRDPFPRDRQTFAFRPSELVGIALGLSKSNLVGSASGSWVRWVIETLPTKNPTPDIWALLLYHYAAALVGIMWPTHLSSRLADYELPDLSLLLGLLTSGGIQRPQDIENRKLTFAIVQRAVALSEDFREPEKLAALLAGISFALRNEIENSIALESKITPQSAETMSEQANPPHYKRKSPAKKAKRPLVVVVHGIRTSGKWFQRIKPILEREGGCVAEPAGFGFLNVFSFLLPGPTRRAAIEIVKRKLIRAIELHKGRPLIIIAHSFGTYCITNILKDSPQIRPRRLLFCGSIVDQKFRWDSLSQMAPELKMAVINECGARDIWPPLAHSMTWGYGGSGSGGFQFPGVVDRHHDLGHSGFFTNEFVQEFWVPFVRDETVAASKYEEGIPETPWWIHMIGMRPLLPWLFWVLLSVSAWAAVTLIRHEEPEPVFVAPRISYARFFGALEVPFLINHGVLPSANGGNETLGHFDFREYLKWFNSSPEFGDAKFVMEPVFSKIQTAYQGMAGFYPFENELWKMFTGTSDSELRAMYASLDPSLPRQLVPEDYERALQIFADKGWEDERGEQVNYAKGKLESALKEIGYLFLCIEPPEDRSIDEIILHFKYWPAASLSEARDPQFEKLAGAETREIRVPVSREHGVIMWLTEVYRKNRAGFEDVLLGSAVLPTKIEWMDQGVLRSIEVREPLRDKAGKVSVPIGWYMQ